MRHDVIDSVRGLSRVVCVMNGGVGVEECC